MARFGRITAAARAGVVLALIASFVLGTAGCSWLAMKRPPRGPAQKTNGRCTTSIAPPVFDITVSTVFLALGGVLLAGAADADQWDAPVDCGRCLEFGHALLATGINAAALGLTSAASGASGIYYRTKCLDSLRDED